MVIIFLLYSNCCLADHFLPEASYQICFTPGENCTQLIVSAIKEAKQEILVQAYSFTSTPIIKALIDQHRKGVKVKVILDRSQSRPHGFSSAKLLMDYDIPTWIDFSPNIAHNKVIIIDKKTVITGSFNFTRAAQERNAENVFLLSDKEVAKRYVENWRQRLSASTAAEDFIDLR